MNGNLTFDSNSLQTFNRSTRVGINTNKILHTNVPEKIAQLYAVANASDSDVPNEDYPSKKVQISGTIHGSTQADLDDRIDTFKGYFTGNNKNLDIIYGSSTRRYTVMTVNAVGVERQDKALFATFAIEFLCKPFGYDITATVITNTTNHTSATLNLTPTIGGTAPLQKPVFTITLDALTGTADYLKVANDNNGQEILLYGLGLVATDVIVIDSVLEEVTVNGDVVDYYGTFLELSKGANSLTYSDGFTTRQVDIYAEYYKRWM